MNGFPEKVLLATVRLSEVLAMPPPSSRAELPENVLFVSVIVKVMSVPAVAVAGPVFVVTTSALEVVVTTVDESFSGFGSAVDETVAVLLNVIPEGVAPGMFPVSVNVVDAPKG